MRRKNSINLEIAIKIKKFYNRHITKKKKNTLLCPPFPQQKADQQHISVKLQIVTKENSERLKAL